MTTTCISTSEPFRLAVRESLKDPSRGPLATGDRDFSKGVAIWLAYRIFEMESEAFSSVRRALAEKYAREY